jgi:Ca2+/H+ antiporter, TMEM165/GDT1 family
VIGFLTALAVAFGVVFVAELGDKTQLLALSFGARHPLRRVAIGLLVGFGAANVVAAVVGGLLGAALPDRPIEIVGGAIFLVFALLALRGDDDDDDTDDDRIVAARSVIASIAFTIVVAEMGDKTQIATATLAARGDPVGTWLGATMGAASSAMVGAFAGNLVGHRIPASALRWLSASLFALFGVLLLSGRF